MTNGGWTLIPPETAEFPLRAYPRAGGVDTLQWFSTFPESGTDISWAIAPSQLRALRDLSTHASMSLAFECVGVRVWRTRDGSNSPFEHYSQSVVFRTTTDSTGVYWAHPDRLTRPHLLTPDVISDGCATDSLAEPSQAEFHFFTSDAHALPIVDVLMYDFAASIEKFGIQLSPVRFTTSPSLPAIGTAAVAPARTCADIWRHNTEQPPDGVYWIDPSMSGSPIRLHCDFSNGGWTGVPVAQSISFATYFSGPGDGSTYTPLSSFQGSPAIEYAVSQSVIQALQAQTTEARQSIVVTCDRIQVWHDTASANPLSPQPIKFESAKDVWGSSSSQGLTIQVNYLEDGCRLKLSGKMQTPMHLHTEDAEMLPITSLSLLRESDSGTGIGFEVGTAWFR